MNRKIVYGAALAVLLAAPYVLYPIFAMKVLCFALFACAFNLLIGFAGLMSFGHAAFFGGAAYVTGLALRDMGLPVGLGLMLGTAAGLLIGLIAGSLAIRRQGIYFAMITLALAQMFYFLCLQAPFTGGEDGMQGVPRGDIFGMLDLRNDRVLYYLILTIVAAAFLLIVRIIHSPFGQVLRAIKENEPRIISLGYDVNKYKLLAFVLSAGIAGLAGAAKTLVLGFASLTDVHWAMSGMALLMTLVGGMGTIVGPIIGAIVIVSLENKLGDLGLLLATSTGIEHFKVIGDSVPVVMGVIFAICVLIFRRGIVGELSACLDTMRAERPGKPRPAAASTRTAKKPALFG